MNGEVPDSYTRFPSRLVVDYVHVYQQGGTPMTPASGYGGPGDALGSGNVAP
jgi:hypothetical protein